MPLVTICFDPFFKDVKSSEKYQNFDSKSWAFSWIDGFQKDFNHSDMLGLWEESNHKFEQIVKEITVIKDEGKDTYTHVVEPTKVRSFWSLEKIMLEPNQTWIVDPVLYTVGL